MIEEAAGTRLYESKKESAEKTIAKKDAKLNEIDRVCSMVEEAYICVLPSGHTYLLVSFCFCFTSII